MNVTFVLNFGCCSDMCDELIVGVQTDVGAALFSKMENLLVKSMGRVVLSAPGF